MRERQPNAVYIRRGQRIGRADCGSPCPGRPRALGGGERVAIRRNGEIWKGEANGYEQRSGLDCVLGGAAGVGCFRQRGRAARLLPGGCATPLSRRSSGRRRAEELSQGAPERGEHRLRQGTEGAQGPDGEISGAGSPPRELTKIGRRRESRAADRRYEGVRRGRMIGLAVEVKIYRASRFENAAERDTIGCAAPIRAPIRSLRRRG